MKRRNIINIQLFGEPTPPLDDQNRQLDETEKDRQIEQLKQELKEAKKQRDDAMLTNQRLYALYVSGNENKNDTEGETPKISKMKAIQEAIRNEQTE